MNINWKGIDQLNTSGLILVLCQDNTGIYNQLMYIVIENKKKLFFENGVLGASHRVYPDKVKAAIYLDEICPTEIIKKFCKV